MNVANVKIVDDAFLIDEVNLFERLGKETFTKLSTRFYDLVYSDDANPWFRNIFASSKKEDAIQNQYEFFIQRMGGPALYNARKGHPALIARHAPFAVTKEAAERWLELMDQTLDWMENTELCLDGDSRRRIWLFCKHTAWFLQAGHEMMQARKASEAHSK